MSTIGSNLERYNTKKGNGSYILPPLDVAAEPAATFAEQTALLEQHLPAHPAASLKRPRGRPPGPSGFFTGGIVQQPAVSKRPPPPNPSHPRASIPTQPSRPQPNLPCCTFDKSRLSQERIFIILLPVRLLLY